MCDYTIQRDGKENLNIIIGGNIITVDYMTAGKLAGDILTVAEKVSQSISYKFELPKDLEFLLNTGCIDKIVLENISDMITEINPGYNLYKITAWSKVSRREQFGTSREFIRQIKFSKDERIFREELKIFGDVHVIFTN